MYGELRKKLHAKKTASSRRTLIVLVALIATFVVLYFVFSGSLLQRQQRVRFADGPVPVLLATAAYADVPIYLHAVGTVKALNAVTVRPQIDGKLIEANFKEGQDVKKGDVLARIDPITFQAAFDQAVAKKAQDQALFDNAKNDLERYEKLAATNAINKQQADTQRALVAQYSAQMRADQAVIDSAQAMLNYTTIRAPIDGRTGLRQVDEGNLVHSSDLTGIVVIAQLKPIAVLFTLPQQNLNDVSLSFAKGPLPIDALRSDTNQVIDHGALSVIDNQIDVATGTVKLKAEFANSDLLLWPGEFVNIRLLIDTLKHAVVIPTAAVQRGPNGAFVYVVGDHNTVSVRAIQMQKQDEMETVVASGVTPPEQVVTSGFVRLTDNATIAAGSVNLPAEDTSVSDPQSRNKDHKRGEQERGNDHRRRSGATGQSNTRQ